MMAWMELAVFAQWKGVGSDRAAEQRLRYFRSFGWRQVSLTPIKDRLGFVTHFVAVLSDVTERKASEAAFQLRDHALSNLNEARAP